MKIYLYHIILLSVFILIPISGNSNGLSQSSLSGKVILTKDNNEKYISHDGGKNWKIIKSYKNQLVYLIKSDSSKYLSYNNGINWRRVNNSNNNSVSNESTSVFPNPTADIINIKFYNKINPLYINLIDNNGLLTNYPLNKASNTDLISIQLDNYPQGNYLIQIIGKENVSNHHFTIVK